MFGDHCPVKYRRGREIARVVHRRSSLIPVTIDVNLMMREECSDVSLYEARAFAIGLNLLFAFHFLEKAE